MPELTRTERLARRVARKREIQRRRRRALGGLIGGVAGIAVIVFAVTRIGGGDETAAAKAHADWRPHSGPVPILEYHVLGDPIPGAPYPELFVTRPDFTAEMNWLDREGYEAVTLDQVERAWAKKGGLPPKPIVLTFDDGYRPQYTFALPELAKHGWAGVLNLKAEGSDLYKSDVRKMIDGGWEVASHTISHPDLTTLDKGRLRHELEESRAILQADFDVPVDNFCYPAGRFNENVQGAVAAAGYEGATTEIPRWASKEHPFALGRFEVLGSSGIDGVKAFLAQSG